MATAILSPQLSWKNGSPQKPEKPSTETLLASAAVRALPGEACHRGRGVRRGRLQRVGAATAGRGELEGAGGYYASEQVHKEREPFRCFILAVQGWL